MTRDWFRSPDWNTQAQADFEQRLRRARPDSRAQYLRIKGLALAHAGHVDAARALWDRVLQDDGKYARLQHLSTLEHLGDSYALENPDRAKSYYRQLLAENPTLNMTTATQHIKLAELLIASGQPEALDEATALLTEWVEAAKSPFPANHFRWNLAVIALAGAAGDPEMARDAARRALVLASRGPVFPRHGDVGVVQTDDLTIARLQRTAAHTTTHDPPPSS